MLYRVLLCSYPHTWADEANRCVVYAARSTELCECGALAHPAVESGTDGELRLSGKCIEITKRKMRVGCSTLLLFSLLSLLFCVDDSDIARDNGHDSIVLGAFGCGAFGNPPRHIAEARNPLLEYCVAVCVLAVFLPHSRLCVFVSSLPSLPCASALVHRTFLYPLRMC